MFICNPHIQLSSSCSQPHLYTSMLPPTRINVLGLLLLFPLHILFVSPYYFSPLSTSTYNFIHFDFPQMSITIHQACSLRVSSIEMFTHSELCFYNFPPSIFTFLTSFSVQGLATPSHFLSTAIFVVLFFSPSPLPAPFECFRFHFSFSLTYPFRVFLRIKNILYFVENDFNLEMLRYLREAG